MRILGTMTLLRVGPDGGDDIFQESQDFLQLAGSPTVLGLAGHTAVSVEGGGRGLEVIVAVIADDVTLDNYVLSIS